MAMQWKRMLMLLAVAGFAAGQAGTAAAQQSPSNRPAPPKAKAYFDMYEPVQRMRLRRETCGDREQTNGAFCVKACKSGYVAMTGTKPPRCRSLTPLPAGQFPGAVRKEIDVQPRRPAPAAKPGAANSGNPKNGW
jgi:hypothetical protein